MPAATAWNVYLNKKLIDTVFFPPDRKKADVYESLVNHDHYDPRIVVRKAR